MSRNPQHFSDAKAGLDRGPKTQKSHPVEKHGDAERIASKRIIFTHPQNTIKNAAALMRENDVRRLPLIEAGTNRLKGMVTAIDILDFLGGGEKYNILEKEYGGNFLKAINCPVRRISRQSQYLLKTSGADEIVKIMIEKHSSMLPVVYDEVELRVIGVITERDMLPDHSKSGITVGEAMKTKVITASKGMRLEDTCKAMVRNQIRRLPVIEEDSLVGVVTALDVLGYLEKGRFKGPLAEENLDTRVEEIMEKQTLTLSPTQDLNQALKLVHEKGIGGFPVVEENKLKGILTTTDILKKTQIK
jgi:CBS domain-containing protein